MVVVMFGVDDGWGVECEVGYWCFWGRLLRLKVLGSRLLSWWGCIGWLISSLEFLCLSSI